MSSLLFLLMVALMATTVAADEMSTPEAPAGNLSSHGGSYELKAEDVEEFVEAIKNQTIIASSGCSCSLANKTCTCCITVNIPVFLHTQICAKIAYLSEEKGFSLQLRCNDMAIYSVTIPVKKPSPICISIPGVKIIKVCIQFYNLDWSGNQFSGCARLQVRLLKRPIATIKLGCFNLGFFRPTPEEEPSDLEPFEEEEFQVMEGDIKNLTDLIRGETTFVAAGCSCLSRSSCSCCVSANVPVIGPAEICVEVAYQSEQGITFSLKYNDAVIFSKTVSVGNPPPICVGVPKFKIAQVCITLSNLMWSDGKLSGCASLQIKIAGVVVLDVNLGCYSGRPFPFEISEESPSSTPLSVITPSEDDEDAVKSEEVEKFLHLLRNQTRAASSGCSCSVAKKSCTCCVSLNIPLILHAYVCAEVAYHPTESSFYLTLKYNDRVILERVINVINSPTIWIELPGLKLVKLGIQLYDLNYGGGQFVGCLRLHVKVLGKVVASLQIGCFNIVPLIPPYTPGHPLILEDKLEMTTEDFETLLELIKREVSYASAGCSCSSSAKSCSCCVGIDLSIIGRADVCVDVAYDSHNIGVIFTLKYNSKVIYTTSVSASNPPAICVGVPGFTSMAKVCIKLSDLDWHSGFSGCVSLQVKVMGVKVLDIQIGCFGF